MDAILTERAAAEGTIDAYRRLHEAVTDELRRSSTWSSSFQTSTGPRAPLRCS